MTASLQRGDLAARPQCRRRPRRQTRLHRHRLRTDLWRTAEAKLPRRQHAAPARRPPRRARRHDHARHGRFPGRVSRRDPRRHRAGAAQHAADRRINTPTCWRIAARGCCSFPKRCCRWSRTWSGGCRTSSTSSSPATMRTATRNCPTNSRGESDSFATVATHADEPAFWLYSSGSTGMPKGVRHLHSNLAGDRRHLRQAGARHPRGRRRPLGRKAVLRLWPRQRADLPDVGRRHHGAQFRAADAGVDVRADEQVQSDASSSACRRCSAAMLHDEALKHERGGSRAAHLHLGRRGAAGIGRQRLEGALRRRHSRRRRLDRAVAYLPVELARRHQIRHLGPSGAGLRGAAGRTRPATTCPTARSANCWCDAPSAGEGYWNQRSKSRADLRGRLDPHRRQIHSRRRRPLHLLRPHRRHVQGVRHLGVAVRGRERADHPSRGAGSRRGARSRPGRTVEAEGVRRAARRREDRRPARGAEGARQAEDRPVEISALDRGRRSLPKTATGKIQRFKLREGASR